MSAMQTFFDALKARDSAAAADALRHEPALLSQLTPAGATPIMTAAYFGAMDVAQQLAAMKTPDAFEAVALGDDAALKRLIAADPALVAAKSTDGWTLLHLAGFFGRASACALLIERGASLSAISTNHMANTPLHAAFAGKCDEATARVLLEAGADANASAAQGVRPIHLAASRGAVGIMQMLADRGAQLNAQMDDGTTAQDFAHERNHAEAFEWLRQKAGA